MQECHGEVCLEDNDLGTGNSLLGSGILMTLSAGSMPTVFKS
jgi:hypothetical protein